MAGRRASTKKGGGRGKPCRAGTGLGSASLSGSDVVGVELEGHSLDVDDITLSGGFCRRSYEVVPGAAIDGVLGSWNGPNVVAENNNRVRYFHYNDLGTVQAQTKADGSMEGVWEPDFFGNYRWAYAGSPVRPELGLTGKIWDEDAKLYYFNARWLDPQRGRWMSCASYRFDI